MAERSGLGASMSGSRYVRDEGPPPWVCRHVVHVHQGPRFQAFHVLLTVFRILYLIEDEPDPGLVMLGWPR
jgi:hypothetical protein